MSEELMGRVVWRGYDIGDDIITRYTKVVVDCPADDHHEHEVIEVKTFPGR